MRTTADRFWSHVTKGPSPEDCWIWTGAIGDDGYGRFWLPGNTAVRAHRHAYQLTGMPLDTTEQIRHSCHLPLCVHATTTTSSHLSPGSRQDNMIDRSAAGRFANQHTGLTSLVQTPKAARAAAMRQLRDHIKAHGYDREAIATTLAGYDPDHPTLFDRPDTHEGPR